MYTLLRSLSGRQLATMQAPAFLAAFLIAELFYKFHSFTLECLAFLATWFLIDLAITAVGNRLAVRRAPTELRP
jgi:hypothetical protein